MSTLVIHLDDRSTDFLTAIYAGMGFPVISSRATSQDAMLRAINKHDRIFMLGHGSPGGLLGFTVDWHALGPVLAAKKEPSMCIWCHADQYARRHKLTGLVSGMFISEVGEARFNGIEATQEEVDTSNALFSATVRSMLDNGEPLEVVQERYSHATCQVTQFNQRRMYVFKEGASTPVEAPPVVHDYESDYRRFASAERLRLQRGSPFQWPSTLKNNADLARKIPGADEMTDEEWDAWWRDRIDRTGDLELED